MLRLRRALAGQSDRTGLEALRALDNADPRAPGVPVCDVVSSYTDSLRLCAPRKLKAMPCCLRA